MSQQSIRHEGLRISRLIMVLSSISPLFILWAIRGTRLIPNWLFTVLCGLLVIGPYLYIFYRLRVAKRQNERRRLSVGKAEDHRDHLLVYLFTMLLPFYTTSLGDWREFLATLVAVCFIVFIFWNLNLHYMNILFAFLGYRIFTIYPLANENPISGVEPSVLITRRSSLVSGLEIKPFRLSDSVLWED